MAFYLYNYCFFLFINLFKFSKGGKQSYEIDIPQLCESGRHSKKIHV